MVEQDQERYNRASDLVVSEVPPAACQVVEQAEVFQVLEFRRDPEQEWAAMEAEPQMPTRSKSS